MLHDQITIIGPKQQSIWLEDNVQVGLEVQWSLSIAATPLDDIHQVGRTTEPIFKLVTITFATPNSMNTFFAGERVKYLLANWIDYRLDQSITLLTCQIDLAYIYVD